MWRVPETPVYHRSNCANPCYDKGGTVRTTFILVNKKSQLSLQGILGLRGAYLLIHLLSGPYCTSLVVAGACTVAMMKNLSLGDYQQVWLQHGRPSCLVNFPPRPLYCVARTTTTTTTASPLHSLRVLLQYRCSHMRGHGKREEGRPGGG